MTPSLLDDPVRHRAATPPPPPPPPRRTARRRGLPLAALLAAGVLGGGASTGILAATGMLDSGGSTTTVVRGTPTATTTSAAALDAGALYADAAPGVVSIRTGSGTGTGFVVDGEGRVVTAAHVVDGGGAITVAFQDGTTRSARLLGADDATDVAVLEVDPSGLELHPLELGDSDALRIGDAVAAIGDPFEFERSLSTGIVSGLDRTIDAPNGFAVAHAIQTDTAVNPGNSGGPLLAADGSVVGLVDQIATGGSASGQSSGVGFAIPSSIIGDVLDQLIAGQPVQHAYMGVSTGDAAGGDGALVGAVAPGGPAAAAGIRPGDTVTAVAGEDVHGSSDLVAAIADHEPGDAVELRLRRGGDERTATVRLGVQPAQRSG